MPLRRRRASGTETYADRMPVLFDVAAPGLPDFSPSGEGVMRKKLVLMIGLICCIALIAGVFVACNDKGQETGEGGPAPVEPDEGTEQFEFESRNEEKLGFYYVVTGYNGSSAEVTIPAAYEDVPVRGIWTEAFKGNENITSVTIPDSVIFIGSSVFEGCTALKSVTIPDSVTSIDYYAFRSCTGLESVTLGRGVVELDDSAFIYCPALTSLTVAEGNATYHSAGNCVINTAEKTVVLGCTGSVIPSDGSVTSIGGWSFSACTGLTSIVIPDSVTHIGVRAFEWCTGLESVTIGSGVTNIGSYAFQGCTALTSVTVPEGVTVIGGGAFDSCTNLREIKWNVTAPVDIGRLIYDDGTEGGGIALTFGENVTSIPDNAFRYCFGLVSVTIPDNVSSIPEGAFAGC